MNDKHSGGRAIGIGATAVLAAVALAAALDAPAVSHQAPEQIRKLAWSNDKTERATDVDLGRKGPSSGDRLVTRGLLFDAAGRQRTGTYVGEIVTHDHKKLLVQTTLTATFPEGQLTVAGSMLFRRVLSRTGATLAITGGTGAYSDAGGSVTMHARKIRGDDGFMFTFDIAKR